MKKRRQTFKKKSDGGYSSLASTGVGDSTMSEGSAFNKAKKMAKKLKNKRGNKMDQLLSIEKEYGDKLSQKEMDELAKILAEEKSGYMITFAEFLQY